MRWMDHLASIIFPPVALICNLVLCFGGSGPARPAHQEALAFVGGISLCLFVALWALNARFLLRYPSLGMLFFFGMAGVGLCVVRCAGALEAFGSVAFFVAALGLLVHTALAFMKRIDGA